MVFIFQFVNMVYHIDLTSDKIDLKVKTITRNKGGHYIMIKGAIQEEDITIVNIYAPWWLRG